MKIDRLIGILATIIQKGKITAPELAERFEVSRRTIQRDIESLSLAGIPVITTQGFDGGISLAEGFTLNKSLLKQDELSDILAGLKGLESVSDNAKIKHLISKLTPTNGSMKLQDFIFIDLASHYKTSLTEKITIFSRAISKKQLVVFDYYSKDGHHVREVEPYFITYKWSSWYVLCYCLKAKDFRLFKLNRLWNACPTEAYFVQREVPENRFDTNEVFDDDKSLILLLDKTVEHLLIEEYGPACYEKLEDGKLRANILYTNKDYILSWILSFGDKARVLFPHDMVEAHKEIIRNMSCLY